MDNSQTWSESLSRRCLLRAKEIESTKELSRLKSLATNAFFTPENYRNKSCVNLLAVAVSERIGELLAIPDFYVPSNNITAKAVVLAYDSGRLTADKTVSFLRDAFLAVTFAGNRISLIF